MRTYYNECMRNSICSVCNQPKGLSDGTRCSSCAAKAVRSKQRAYALSPEGNAARRRAGAIGGGSNRNTDVTDEQVRAMNATGMSGLAIAKELGVGYQVIRRRLGRV
jgi:hypothetical protein